MEDLINAIEFFQAKVDAQGIVKNERDVNHLENMKELLINERAKN